MRYRLLNLLIDHIPPFVCHVIALSVFLAVTDMAFVPTIVAWFLMVLMISSAARWDDAAKRWNEAHR